MCEAAVYDDDLTEMLILYLQRAYHMVEVLLLGN